MKHVFREKATRVERGPQYYFSDDATYKLPWGANTSVHQDPETESGRHSTASLYRKMDKRPMTTVCRSVKMMVPSVHQEKPHLLTGLPSTRYESRGFGCRIEGPCRNPGANPDRHALGKDVPWDLR